MKLVILLVLLVLLVIACDSRLRIIAYSVASPLITQPVRIVVLADLHSCSYGAEQQQLIEAIEAQQPDIICLVGDIYDEKLPAQNTEDLLKKISKYPCFYVTGNHECYSKNLTAILELFAGYNINILQGEEQKIEIRGQSLSLCGVDDPQISRRHPEQRPFVRQLAAVAEESDPDCFRILLAHRPERIQEYLAGDFDLVFSGHAHGGQWRIPGLLNGIYAPNQGLLPKYAGGRYDFTRENGEATTMLVSRGLARESTPLIPRIFNRPELVVVDLTAETQT